MRQRGIYLVACLAMCLLASGVRADFILDGDPVQTNSWSIDLTSTSGRTFTQIVVATYAPGGVGNVGAADYSSDAVIANVPGGQTQTYNGGYYRYYSVNPWTDSSMTVTFNNEDIGGDAFDFIVWGWDTNTSTWHGTLFEWDGTQFTNIAVWSGGMFLPIPLPAPALLAGVGLVGVVGRRRLNQRRSAA